VSILIGRETRLLVQGITGREGDFHARAMQEYGTRIVAGMTPGKGGQGALDGSVPVFNTVAEAVAETGANATCIFVPGAGATGPDPRGRRRRDRDDLLHHGGHPDARHGAGRRSRPASRSAAHRPELSRRDVARPGEGWNHPGLGPSRRLRGRRLAFRNPDV